MKIVKMKDSPPKLHKVVKLKENYYVKEFQKEQSGVIICFDCSDVQFISEFPDKEEKHITLLYMGNSENVNKEDTISKLKEFANTHGPISGEFDGSAAFMNRGEGFPIVLLFDSPALPDFRSEIQKLFPTFTQEHGFTPHMTLMYSEGLTSDFIASISNSVPTFHTFNSISFWYNGERHKFELNVAESVKSKEIKTITNDELVVKRYDNPDVYDVSKELTQFDALSRNNSTPKKMVIIDDDFVMQTFIKNEAGESFDISNIYAQMFVKSNKYFEEVNQTVPTFKEHEEMLQTINAAISKILGIEYEISK